ncbi:YkvA family protein [Salinarimonas sp. NSM]|uniref:YkvA family protein n=1 Tax=Salinarimonas sp. NSM TaxID=3458003 RepID=UPI004036E34C
MSLRDGARRIRADVVTLVRAVRDPHTPRTAKALAVLIVLYVASPFDLVPDWHAVIGLADDLVVVVAGLAGLHRLIPPEQLADHRARVEAGRPPLPRGRARPLAGAVMWLVALTALAWWGFGWIAGA